MRSARASVARLETEALIALREWMDAPEVYPARAGTEARLVNAARRWIAAIEKAKRERKAEL